MSRIRFSIQWSDRFRHHTHHCKIGVNTSKGWIYLGSSEAELDQLDKVEGLNGISTTED
ncbi:hypothetical protein [Parendozoicomonas sp. Alg238-R29]|uniref:hypothetical protein n=1 Tax=Parendozoicomonas sp. Alg238-R29 TaxID=2993446 RepID=UPI00248E62A8|nr:hypothetical protein [Parendozoicomonas sp. Alg238-R29]